MSFDFGNFLGWVLLFGLVLIVGVIILIIPDLIDKRLFKSLNFKDDNFLYVHAVDFSLGSIHPRIAIDKEHKKFFIGTSIRKYKVYDCADILSLQVSDGSKAHVKFKKGEALDINVPSGEDSVADMQKKLQGICKSIPLIITVNDDSAPAKKYVFDFLSGGDRKKGCARTSTKYIAILSGVSKFVSEFADSLD